MKGKLLLYELPRQKKSPPPNSDFSKNRHGSLEGLNANNSGKNSGQVQDIQGEAAPPTRMSLSQAPRVSTAHHEPEARAPKLEIARTVTSELLSLSCLEPDSSQAEFQSSPELEK